MEFQRKSKEDKPVLAICYDFDKTLTPDDMQAQGFIQSINLDVKDFWIRSNTLAEENDMDQTLAYMYSMIDGAMGNVLLTKKSLENYGANVKLFKGVEKWFDRIKKYGEEKGVIVEHYIISSGLKEMIEGTSVAKKGVFEKIYASSFYYNEKGVPVWPAQVVNFTNKTQFLFRIKKGVLDINDQGINDYFNQNEIRVPFRNIVYIGDSDTDIPCMKLVNTNGGHSIGVFNPEDKDKDRVYKMIRDNRIKYFVSADYSENSDLDRLVKAIIDKTVSYEKLEEFHYKCEKEKNINSNKEYQKTDLIIALWNSGSFARTHSIISELSKFSEWTEDEKYTLCDIAVDNNQVWCIITDYDIKEFYKEVLKDFNVSYSKTKKIKETIGIK